MKINWIGCKQKLLSKIINHLPSQFETYYEPFLGSGALYFHLQPQKAVLNDNDSQLMTMWQQSLQHPYEFFNKVKENENYIYQHQDQSSQKQTFKNLLEKYNDQNQSDLTRSTIFYVLQKYAFRGIMRYNKQNELKTNFGYKPKFKKPIIFLNELIAFSNHFQKNNHVLQCTDFSNVIANSQNGDFLFIDPPYYYDGIVDKTFYLTPFTYEDHQELADILHQATQRGVKWLYTNYNVQPIRDLFLNCNHFPVKTTTSHNITNKNKVSQEIIIKNY